jgi:hypothetical protein
VLDLLPGGAQDVAIHPLGPLGAVPTLMIWRRGHDSAALGALREALIAEGDGRTSGESALSLQAS